MKSTILNIKKRVLVVEMPSELIYSTSKEQLTEMVKENLNLKDIDLLGLGSELSEEIAQDLVPLKSLNEESEYCGYPIYTRENGIVNKAKFSFISAIEANGFTWNSENPYTQKPYEGADDYEVWKEFEAKNFHPEQCLIFEIL